VASKLEALHDAVVSGDAMAIVARFKRFDEDNVAVGVVREHYVVVAAARADGEAAHVVSVELADGFDDDEQFVEYYDLAADPYNLKNLAQSTPAAKLASLSAQLKALKVCVGVNCRNV